MKIPPTPQTTKERAMVLRLLKHLKRAAALLCEHSWHETKEYSLERYGKRTRGIPTTIAAAERLCRQPTEKSE